MANNTFSTIGLTQMALGSRDTFGVRASKGGLPWNLAGGTASLVLADPSGTKTTLVGTVDATGYTATASWAATGLTGVWTRAWTLQDGSGLSLTSLPIAFQVVSSPV